MSGRLSISIGQHSDKGRKQANQDFHGALIPDEPLLSLKGIAIALADGISSSEVSAVAAKSAVKSFLTDYYCTPETWSVKTSAQRVLAAANSWLHAQTRRMQHHYEEKDRGYVCTLSAMVFQSTTAHIFHVGDARIYRMAGRGLDQLTEDHRVILSSTHSYLGRALGVNAQTEIDYRSVSLATGDVFILATDGVYEYVSSRFMADAVGQARELDVAARSIVEEAYRQGSADNLTVQVVRIDDLPSGEPAEILTRASDLPCPPLLEPRMEFDGYTVVREISASSRSHIYLAMDSADLAQVAVKIPSIEGRGDAAYLRRFKMEEWVARRIDNPHVLKAREPSRQRSYIYFASEFVDGQTLTQWMIDNPSPRLEIVRDIVEQVAKGLQAFHRLEMLHQDLRPANVMIDRTGTAKIIDFGSTTIAGVAGEELGIGPTEILGTAQYTAPEYFLGEGGSQRSDIFSLGVIAYQMLTGRLPYGAEAARVRTRAHVRRLRYASALDDSREIPAWIDGVLRKAVHPDPRQRYDELSEFLFDLRHPKDARASSTPLMERNPLLFWQLLSAMLFIVVVGLLLYRLAGR